MNTRMGDPRRASSRHLPFGEKRDSRFYGQHILSVSQFDRGDLVTIFEVAREMRGMVERVGCLSATLARHAVSRLHGGEDPLNGSVQLYSMSPVNDAK